MSNEFSKSYVQTFIAREEFRRQSNKVLHGHPSPGHWKPLDEPVEFLLDERSGYAMRSEFDVNLYVGTPFCIKTKPARCGFCLFPSEDYEGNSGVEDYIAYLQKEFEMYKPFYGSDHLASIYFGGGTPNLYHPEHYGQIMEFVDQLYGGVPADIEKTLEGIPQLFNEAKLRAISEAGFNRVSMGVQQLNDDLIKYSGRRQTRKQVFDAVDLCHKYNLANSMDLIYGWPEQTVENMLTDLKDAISAGVNHLTHYELNVAGRSDFATPKKRALLPTIETNIEMYQIAGDFLRSQGFEQVTVYDWSRKADTAEDIRKGSYDYEHSMHDFVEQEDGKVQRTKQVCGIGYAAVNFHPNGLDADDRSWIYMNQTSLKNYCQDLDDGKFPVGRGFMYNHQDVKLAWIFQSMQTMAINHVNYEQIFQESLISAYEEVWNELANRKWIVISDVDIQFIGNGQYYIPMLQSLIASIRLEEIRNAKKLTVKDIPVVVEATA